MTENRLSICRQFDEIERGHTFHASMEKERLKTALEDKADGGHVDPTPELTTYGIKLGWIQGVLIPCLLNIWGVMLFLRISWIVAQAGIALTIIIIIMSGVVCLITTMSLSAICTNSELEGGGVYYLVSRSLGAEMGASVGIIFAFANAVAASMNTIGFCESLNELLKSYDAKILDNGMNDTRIIGAIALLVMCLICAVGMDWESKTQNFLVVVILLAIANYIIGVSMGPQSNEQIAKGFVGVNLETARENWYHDFRRTDGVMYNFFSVFAMYFPAVTGVQAGANICGDLKNPAKAIPKGTFLAVLISLSSYLAMAVLAGMGALRDASGNPNNLNHTVLAECKPDCAYGLHNSYKIMHLMSLWPPLIYGGCWAATLSTALTNLLSVPRLIQALGTDRIYPGLIYFSKPYGKHGEPYRGYVLTYLVSLLFLLIADLNTIAPLISNFYLASYALINFCTFHAAYVKSINWRPTYRKYNKWLSLFGFLMCLGIMMVISWVMALVTVLIFMALYLLVVYTKPEASWGSSTETQRYKDTVTTIIELSRHVLTTRTYHPQAVCYICCLLEVVLVDEACEPHPSTQPLICERKNPRFWAVCYICCLLEVVLVDEACEPHPSTQPLICERKNPRFWVLVLAGKPYARPVLLDIGRLLTKQDSFMIVADIETSFLSPLERSTRARLGQEWVASRGDRALAVLLHGFQTEQAVRALTQCAGLGRLSPNMLLVGFKNKWTSREHASIARYVAVIRQAYSEGLSVLVLRAPQSARPPRPLSNLLPASSSVTFLRAAEIGAQARLSTIMRDNSGESLVSRVTRPRSESSSTDSESEQLVEHAERERRQSQAKHFVMLAYQPIDFEQSKPIDAWWLCADGGVGILLPYIISQRGFRQKRTFRIFALGRTELKMPDAQEQMKQVLARFRIEYSELRMLSDVDSYPGQPSWDLFHAIVARFRTEQPSDGMITDAELAKHHNKTCRHLRIRELMLEHSADASFIVITLPDPRKRIPACLYMTWLEVLSAGTPPVLLARGNQNIVLDI